MYTSAISAYGKRKQWPEAVRLLREMEGRRVAPDLETYNSAIKACGDRGQWQVTILFPYAMTKKGISPHVIPYSSSRHGVRGQRTVEPGYRLTARDGE